MGKCKDHRCYGRLWYDAPHDTVHSYHKPHWHRSLIPFAPRVMSVREKARIQGFPDTFNFTGKVDQQYKMIGNAVSPQLAKALARSILLAHVGAAGRSTAGTKFGGNLRNLREFVDSFDESKLAAAAVLHKPVPVEKPVLSPMTYEEVLVEYNTEQRKDHSIRFAASTPSIFNHFSGHANGERRGLDRIESEGSIGKVSVRRVFRYLQIGPGPQRSPSACSEMLLKNTAQRPLDQVCSEHAMGDPRGRRELSRVAHPRGAWRAAQEGRQHARGPAAVPRLRRV